MAVQVPDLLSPIDSELVDEIGELGALMLWQNGLSDILGVLAMEEQTGMREMVACLSVEAAEAQAHFLNGTKPWKSQIVDRAEVDEEMIDCLHFIFAYFNVRGIPSEEVVRRFRAKNLRNFDRIKEKMNAKSSV